MTQAQGKMEEKKSIKSISLTVLLILALILIVAMSYYIYTQKINTDKKISSLENIAISMQNTINNLQQKINDNKSNITITKRDITLEAVNQSSVYDGLIYSYPKNFISILLALNFPVVSSLTNSTKDLFKAPEFCFKSVVKYNLILSNSNLFLTTSTNTSTLSVYTESVILALNCGTIYCILPILL